MKKHQSCGHAFIDSQIPSYKHLTLVSVHMDLSETAQYKIFFSLFVDICTFITLVTAFLQNLSHVSLGLYGQTIGDTYTLQISGIYMWTVICLFLVVHLFLTRMSIRDFWGLRKAIRAQARGEFAIKVSDYMRVLPASWLHLDVIDALSPIEIQDLLQQGQDWSQHLVEILQNAPEEKRPPVTILISLSDHVTVSILSQDGKQETIEFKNNSWNAALAFFTLQNKGGWIPRKTAENKIYGAEHGDLLALHTSRINAQINQVAQDAGFLDEPEFEGEKGKLDLFEQDKNDPRHLWRLSPRCEVEILSDLTTLYEQVLAAQTGQTPLHRDALRRSCHQILERYGKGLLAEHQENHRIWSWLRDAYITYRDQLLVILEYAASCEWQVAQTLAHTDVAECQETTWHSARFSGWSALIALGIVSRPDVGEPSLIRCLERFYLLKDIDAAGSVYQAYAERMLERDSRWTPRLKILETWPEVTRWQPKKKQSQKGS